MQELGEEGPREAPHIIAPADAVNVEDIVRVGVTEEESETTQRIEELGDVEIINTEVADAL